jgi:hypothetical protein
MTIGAIGGGSLVVIQDQGRDDESDERDVPPPSAETGREEEGLQNAARAAYALAVYAAENAMSVSVDTYAAIARFRERVTAKRSSTPIEEAEFLKAYEDLGRATQPVSAKSLRDTDDSFGRRNLFGQKRSEARRFATTLATRTGLIVALLGLGEFTQNVVRGTLAKQEEAGRLQEEKRKLWVEMAGLTRRATAAPEATADTKSFVLTEALLKEKDELDRQIETTEQAHLDAKSAADEGNTILSKVLRIDPVSLRYLLPTVAQTLGGFILPLLYGALGACAFLLRRVVQNLHERSFIRKRSSDYGVRFYLGTVSSVAVQWVFVGDGKEVPGGFTPAVLAFAGGYSVDAIFAVFDRVIRTVTETIRPTSDQSGEGKAETRVAQAERGRVEVPEERRGPNRPFQPGTPPPGSETGAAAAEQADTRAARSGGPGQ